MQFVDLEAIIAQGKRVTISVEEQLPNEIQQKIGDRLVGIRPAQDARQRRVAYAIAPALAVRTPMIPGAHGHGLRIGRDARFDHRRARTDRQRVAIFFATTGGAQAGPAICQLEADALLGCVAVAPPEQLGRRCVCETSGDGTFHGDGRLVAGRGYEVLEVSAGNMKAVLGAEWMRGKLLVLFPNDILTKWRNGSDLSQDELKVVTKWMLTSKLQQHEPPEQWPKISPRPPVQR